MGGREIFQPIIRVIVYVSCSDGLGGIVYSILGFSEHYIQHDLIYQIAVEFLRPLTAAVMGVIVFFFIVGGLIGLGMPLQTSSRTVQLHGKLQYGLVHRDALMFFWAGLLARASDDLASAASAKATVGTARCGSGGARGITAGRRETNRLENMGGAKAKGLRHQPEGNRNRSSAHLARNKECQTLKCLPVRETSHIGNIDGEWSFLTLPG